MALINCPECNKEISDKALTCPNCGIPINCNNEICTVQPQKITIAEKSVTESNKNEIQCPDFPANMEIGQQITNWAFDSAFSGMYNERINVISGIPSGKVLVTLHTHGIQLIVGTSIYQIHNSQIINILKTTEAEISKVNKSVIGRAVVGDLLMGPLGAVIGGMSGTGTKDKICVTQYVVINFWETETRRPQSIVIICDENQRIEAFINRQKREQETNMTENRTPKAESTPIWAIICLIVIIISVIYILFS